jgi:hypothetical protein
MIMRYPGGDTFGIITLSNHPFCLLDAAWRLRLSWICDAVTDETYLRLAETKEYVFMITYARRES